MPMMKGEPIITKNFLLKKRTSIIKKSLYFAHFLRYSFNREAELTKVLREIFWLLPSLFLKYNNNNNNNNNIKHRALTATGTP